MGALLTAFFSNDATALILTPIVFVLVTRLKLNPLPYVFACAFIANTASILLPVSNPVNLLAVERFGLTLGDYLKFLLLPGVLAITINIGLFLLIFKKSIPSRFAEMDLGEPVKVDAFFLFVCGSLGVIAVGYIVVSVFGLPVAWPALGGALILVISAISFRRFSFSRLSSGISWSIFLFIFSLALLVRGLEDQGITARIAEQLVALSSRGTAEAVFSIAIGTAVGSNLINNWSMMMISVSSLEHLSGQLAGNHSLIYSAIMGADLGPNIAILGSLSSMLWLLLLKRRGLDIHPLQYFRLGLIVAPPMLIVGALSIYVIGWSWG